MDSRCEWRYRPVLADQFVTARLMLLRTGIGKKLARKVLALWIILTLIPAVCLALWHLVLGILFLLVTWTTALVLGRGSVTEWFNEKLVRKMVQRSSTEHQATDRCLTVLADKLAVGSEGSNLREFRWEELASIELAGEDVFLTFSGDQFVFLPIRIFDNVDERDAFICGCRSRMKNNTSEPRGVNTQPTSDEPVSIAYSNHPTNVRNTFASIALITGLIALLSTCVPMAGLIAGALAMTFGIIAAQRARQQTRMRGMRRAIFGMVAGATSVAASVLFLAVLGTLVSFVPIALLRSLHTIVQSPLLSLADDVEATSNAAALAQGCRLYAAGHNSSFPPHLAAQLIAKYCKEAELHVPGSKTPTLDMRTLPPSESDWKKAAPAVEGVSDFAYVGTDLSTAAMGDPAALIVVYGKEYLADGGRPVGFADGNGKYLNPAEFDAAVDECNRVRGSMGLPPLPKIITPL